MREQLFFVGCYTKLSSDIKGHGRGIYQCSLDLDTGEMSLYGVTPGITNPSYLAVDSRRKRLFAVQECLEKDNPAVCAFKIRTDGQLEPLNQQPVAGELPCHLSVDEGGRWLAVANYASGSVALYPIGETGHIGMCSDTVTHHGCSRHPVRQTEPHAHAAVFGPDGTTLFVPDLGLDEIKRYDLLDGGLTFHQTTRLTPGSGPRHLSFHPSGRYAFVINELACTVTVLHHERGRLTPVSTVSTLSEAGRESSAAAVQVAPSGSFVYASNRGQDSLAAFAFGERAGTLTHLQHVQTGGRTPRDFALEPGGRLLIVANQDTDTLVSFWVDTKAGKLDPTGYSLSVETPVCVKTLATTSEEDGRGD